MHELVKQALNIEMKKIEDSQDNTDYEAKHDVVCAHIDRIEREEREES